MKTEIFKTFEDFLNREDKTLNGVSEEFAKENPNYSEERNNEGCWDCSYCSYCSEKNGQKEEGFNIPVIENIHQKVLGAVSVEGAFDMGTWHSCDTTHCRAGWVVVLAGKQQIYKKSSPIHVAPTRFYETDKVAMADIKRCAKEELESVKP